MCFKNLILLSFVFVFSLCFGEENDPSNSPIPKILFHGGGGGAPAFAKDMEPAAKQLVRLGFPREHIYKVKYPDSKNIADMLVALKPQFEEILSHYPEGTPFDTIGHSLGHVVSLVSVARLNLLSRLRKLIGIAGVMFGQMGNKPWLCGYEFLAPYYCGDIFDLLIGTHTPSVVMDILEKNAAEMSSVEKCSLFSPEDGVLNPYDSGAFSDGINISIPNVSHLKFKSSPQVFSAMKEACFNGQF